MPLSDERTPMTWRSAGRALGHDRAQHASGPPDTRGPGAGSWRAAHPGRGVGPDQNGSRPRGRTREVGVEADEHMVAEGGRVRGNPRTTALFMTMQLSPRTRPGY